VLDAHLDTVFPEETDVTVKMKGDTLYAPGVGDDTRGLVMVVTVLRAMNKADIKTTSGCFTGRHCWRRRSWRFTWR
jgi:acetylornithine deacetylase/succinyl-diaminopimelate desuccinylase-like protein